MAIGATSSSQQMQMQQRKMDGSGQGQGNGGMKDIMQSLSSEDRTALKEKMSSLSQADRSSMVEQFKQVDATTMSADEYSKTLLDMLDQSKTKSTSNSSAAYGFSAYA
ncbi:MAG: hypothetical protein COA39_002320 [Sulfurimonas sp.]|nr:hypothetical protein [Sulfurimonas sp.]